jgi:lysophospholipase L1-like esterase
LFWIGLSAACDGTPLTVTPGPPGGDEPRVQLDAGVWDDAGAPPALDGGATIDTGVRDAGSAADAGAIDTGRTPLGDLCFSDIYDPNANGPNYDQFNPTYGTHCVGTNHQAINGIERVVFLGDSVTVGTPPTGHEEYYRSVLADRLTSQFNLDPPSDLWKRSSLVGGTSMVQESGDFASCAKFGARTDDLIEDSDQILSCFPDSTRSMRTLVIMTIGGNDIAAITKAGAPSGGKTYAEVEQMTMEFIARLDSAVRWFFEDPSRFPNGVYIVFSNMFEFTDATGDVTSCPAAGVAGFDEPWANPSELEHLVIWANEQYMRIAVDTGTDMIFMLEHFCGHGYHHDDPGNRCYRGPTAERWFDLTCIHPNPVGHSVIADMFMSVVLE